MPPLLPGGQVWPGILRLLHVAGGGRTDISIVLAWDLRQSRGATPAGALRRGQCDMYQNEQKGSRDGWLRGGTVVPEPGTMLQCPGEDISVPILADARVGLHFSL